MGDVKVNITGESGEVHIERSSISLLENRLFGCSAKAILGWILLVTVLTICLYIPHKALYAFHYYKIHLYMGNKSSTSGPVIMAGKLHIKCRGPTYPRNDSIKRFPVPDNKVPWNVPFPEYKPTNYTAPSVLSKPVWADPEEGELRGKNLLWNKVDGKVDRSSLNGKYNLGVNGLPLNPSGRTGVTGRGCLGRWGPNHAADPIVTRWKRDERGQKLVDKSSGKPMLQFIAIQRKDSGEWAIPGGMVDPGEVISVTLKREFSEEALNSLEASAAEKKQIENAIETLFEKGNEVYRGYVDDPRNTDNSWMETIAVNFHDDNGTSAGKVQLNAGDDAVGVKWTDMHKGILLFASHSDFVKRTAQLRNAFW